MDESTKSAIEDLLKTVKKRSASPVDYRLSRSEVEARRRALDDERERAYREHLERETKRREREAEPARKEALIREEARREEERVRRATEAQREHFAQLSNPPRFFGLEDLRNEVAALSVNSAKACVVLRCIQCKELVDQLEREVAPTKRQWNGLDMVWEFHPSAMAQVRSILGLYFKDIQVVGVPKAIPATKFDQLLAKLTKDDKNKIYRLLAGTYHPDKGGSAEVMTLINLVFKEK